ncbi:CTP pyrophosphohydrolase [Poriferisphaera corsica]|uniref:8-oxo-dGTP diphosphatase n=1 Tax=Poriferisphaera corsica TaxID=2528020 RepID=A0A517YW14_9BACT|nr:(deoxy)nucleoside triphosphate pyrophosphohydrolase [Poriferisphaera corsica]QDU34410.1 CTP pyrophosphohydrolase [Poriferisphaera corsica]
MSDVICVAIGVLVDGEGDDVRVLIAKRPESGVLAGYWEFPGGKLEKDETLEDCVVREFAEELGVRVSVTGCLKAVRHEYDYGVVELNPFYCRWESGELENLAVVDHRWVKPNDLRRYQFPEANISLVERVIIDLGGKVALAS